MIPGDECATAVAASPAEARGEGGGRTRRIGAAAIRRGLLVNVAGTLVPAVVAVVCVRYIVDGLGQARFGLLALVWTFINAVGILDLGIGRALTRFLAVHEDRDEAHEAAVVWTSLTAILALGVLGGIAAWSLADVLAASLTRVTPGLRVEAGSVLRVLSLSVPLMVLSSGLRGILEAFGRFDLTNRVSIPVALLNLVSPVVLLHLGVSLPGIVAALVLIRLVGTLLLCRLVVGVAPAMRAPRLAASGMRSVLAFAGWTTVSNVPGPLFAQAERYFLGSLAALSAVAFYSTPADLLSRVTVIPAAVLQVMFPVLAQTVVREPERASRLASRALLLIAAAVLPALTVLVAVAPEALELWLGPEFARHGARAGRILAFSVYVNCMAWLPFSLVQSAGRASWTGKLHVLEMPLYLALAAFLIHGGGIEGAATANLLRSSADAGVVVYLAARVLGPKGRLGRRYAMLVGVGLVAMLGAAAPVNLGLRLLWSVAALAVAATAAWRHLLDAEAREALSTALTGAWARLRSAAP